MHTLESYHTCVRAVFRIDFDSSLFDRLLIRTLFHRCAQCFVDMFLFDPTSPSVKSYQLAEVVAPTMSILPANRWDR